MCKNAFREIVKTEGIPRRISNRVRSVNDGYKRYYTVLNYYYYYYRIAVIRGAEPGDL